MSQDINESHIAMLRGVKNCGQHHEENKFAPAVQFAQECDGCAGRIVGTLWNAGVAAATQMAIEMAKRHQ